MSAASLAGVSVLVTRPLDLQKPFIQLLDAEGATAVSLPCLQIDPVINPAVARSQLLATAECDVVIFTSINAVQQAHNLVQMPWFQQPGFQQKNHQGHNRQPALLATGPATAAALSKHEMPLSESPQAPYNSEALLNLPTLQQKSLQKVAIIKGQGGREHLAQTLRNKGITLTTVSVYTRSCPVYDDNTLDTVFLNSPPDIVTITSNESLINLVSIAGKKYQTLLLNLPLIVNSDRCASLAKKLGFQSRVMIAPLPGDHGQLEAVKQWNRSDRPKL